MKQLLIITAAICMAALSQAAETGTATAAQAAPVAGKHIAAMSKDKELVKKCKAEHKGDHKAYVECLKTAKQ